MNVFEKIFKELDKEKVKYLVVGGVAVSLHGYPRFTGDLDLLLYLEKSNLEKVDRVMKKLKYFERLPISVMQLSDRKKVKKWMKEKNLKAFSFCPPQNNPLTVDIIIEESLDYTKLNKTKVIKKVGGIAIPVISFEGLVKMKKKAGRPQDIRDLQALADLKKL